MNSEERRQLAEKIKQAVTSCVNDANIIKSALIAASNVGHLTGGKTEQQAMAEDAISVAVTQILDSLNQVMSGQSFHVNGQGHSQQAKNQLSIVMRLLSSDKFDIDSEVKGYVVRSVQNYCKNRIARRLTQKKCKSTGVTTTSPRVQPLPGDDIDSHTEFFEKNITNHFTDVNLDLERIDQMLTSRGLSGEEISFIKTVLDGASYSEIAKSYGGKSDKYRKRYQMLLKKAGLESIKDGLNN